MVDSNTEEPVVYFLIFSQLVRQRLIKNMEGRKKREKASLEEKQMKRYFRSIKRSKSKNKKDSRIVNEVVCEKNRKNNGVSIPNMRDTIADDPREDISKSVLGLQGGIDE